jgi:hypothetical protein
MAVDWRPEFERRYVPPIRGRVLIVGSKVFPTRDDRRKAHADAFGVDAEAGDGVDLVHDMEQPLPESVGKFAHVECTSVLEHCPQPWMVAAVVEDALIEGGTILLSVPFVWPWHGYPADYFRFTAEGVQALFPRIEWESLIYAGETMSADHSLKAIKPGRLRYFPRCEVFGFGRKKCES